jgi:sulfate adenylyltransferase subunit 1 (EFTu-like GTPase family)
MENRNEEIRELYDEAVASSLEHLDTLPKDSKEYADCVDSMTKMYRLRMEQAKADDEYEDAYKRRIEEIEKRQADNELRKQQMAQQHKEFKMKLLADVVTNGVKIGTFVVVGKWSAVLESGGVIASGTAKNLIRGVQKFVDFNKY